MKVSTVNVVEINNGIIDRIHSFTDNEDGSKQADEMFTDLAKEYGCPADDIEDCVEDGIYENKDNYTIFLVHSD